MKNLKRSVIALFALLLITNCSPVLYTTKITDKDLGNYKTFAYLPNTNFEVSEGSTDDRDKIAKSVIKAMNENMIEAGYTLDTKNPDILVLLTTSFDKEKMKDVDAVYASYPYRSTSFPASPYYDGYSYQNFTNQGPFLGYDVDYSSYKVGTLIVDIIDRQTKKKVWSGKAEKAIYNRNTIEEIEDYVDAIFDEYPKANSRNK